jgi:hypothetical protein
VAGISGYASLTWVNRRPGLKKAVPASEVYFQLGGLDSNGEGVHLDWVSRYLAPGDVLQLKILEADVPDEPREKSAVELRAETNRQHLKEFTKRRKEADVAIARLERLMSKERRPPKRK